MGIEVNGEGSKDARKAARRAGLVYVKDDQPGIRRLRAGKGFRYENSTGKGIRAAGILNRIKKLAIPPAWTDVWICPNAQGHVQATGRDERGRKQHRYHPHWREVRDDAKYGRLIAFGKVLPRVRSRVRRDLRKRGLPREKVLAAVVRLLETTLIRVGNEDYARQNHSYGLTTLRDDHVKVRGKEVRFHFRGKSRKWHDIELSDRRLARIVKACQDLPGQELFQYRDDAGEVHQLHSNDVNEYLREIAGDNFTAKDFRTWAATVMAAHALHEFEAFDTKTQARRNVMSAIESVAKQLGNTKTICRKCYVHPDVVDAYLDGTLAETLSRRIDKKLSRELRRLKPEEAAVLAFLHDRLRHRA